MDKGRIKLILFIIFQIIFAYYVIIMPIFYDPMDYKIESDYFKLIKSIDLNKCKDEGLDNKSLELCKEMTTVNKMATMGITEPIYGIQKIDIYRKTNLQKSFWLYERKLFPWYLFLKHTTGGMITNYIYIPSFFSLNIRSIRVEDLGYDGWDKLRLKFTSSTRPIFDWGNVALIFTNLSLSLAFLKKRYGLDFAKIMKGF
ncbi:MAG: hypothetical protein NTW06_01575 [Candidatus Falkowbacteria bacterium]|nr:hypothetical protein [Candidatus Falkowbacteria bacterium]